MKEFVTPTPRDQRVIVLSKMNKWQLTDRAIALGWSPTTRERIGTTDDELIAMILDAEQTRGMVAR